MDPNILQSIEQLMPRYEAELPFSKEKVTFTPFRVKDAKNISIILQEENKKLSLVALVEILKTNTQGVNVLDLCLADAEYLFLQIRSKSVDERLNLIRNEEKLQLYIFDIKHKNEIVTETINISPEINLVLETPTINNLIKLNSLEKEDLIKSCIKKIVVKNEIYYPNKFLPKDLKDILDNLPMSMLGKFENFLANQPELYAMLETKDGPKEVSGFLNFFIFR